MKPLRNIRFSVLLALLVAGVPTPSAAQTAGALPSPLRLGDVVRLARERRGEIQAAPARMRAGETRPAIVSALADPMISPSLDHLPFMLNGANWSVTVEQQFPLSGIRGHRRASALADVDRLRAEADRTTLDVGVQAANAFLMLMERRRTDALVAEQLTFAREVVAAANARYASGTAAPGGGPLVGHVPDAAGAPSGVCDVAASSSTLRARVVTDSPCHDCIGRCRMTRLK